MIAKLFTGDPQDYIELTAETTDECLMLARIGTSKMVRSEFGLYLQLGQDDTIRLHIGISKVHPHTGEANAAHDAEK